jgi:UDP-N-acetylglucosamine:LPS N-acetylglucosamine transferase
MLRILAAGITAVFVTASPVAYAQTPANAAPLSAADLGKLTDMRVNIVKAALQLTPEQEKYWPAIEDAIRTRAKDRQARIADMAKRVAELREGILSTCPSQLHLMVQHWQASARRRLEMR